MTFMSHGRMSKTGIESARNMHESMWYAVVRPNGRTSRKVFKSNLRAAEHACKVYGKTWPKLHSEGFTVRCFYYRH
jgi:hypothetical protein